ncbi:MAG TPA: hypothetical protein P5120_17220 [Spirochaetota bacterium]|nr:hypothetical protein [Spirochaetota bacterium]HRX49264.1 hypothetical protein [Spirochaetota bacterium]
MSDDELKEILTWLREQTDKIEYGEISVTCIIHAGKVKRLIKTLTENELIQ